MVQESVLDELGRQDIAVHVIWTPVMAGDDLAAAESAVETVMDPRALHYWDEDLSLGIAYKDCVPLPEGNDELAWDIDFVYERGTRWGDHPPVPTNWWHQLAFDERFLAGGEELREELGRLADEL